MDVLHPVGHLQGTFPVGAAAGRQTPDAVGKGVVSTGEALDLRGGGGEGDQSHLHQMVALAVGLTQQVIGQATGGVFGHCVGSDPHAGAVVHLGSLGGSVRLRTGHVVAHTAGNVEDHDDVGLGLVLDGLLRTCDGQRDSVGAVPVAGGELGERGFLLGPDLVVGVNGGGAALDDIGQLLIDHVDMAVVGHGGVGVIIAPLIAAVFVELGLDRRAAWGSACGGAVIRGGVLVSFHIVDQVSGAGGGGSQAGGEGGVLHRQLGALLVHEVDGHAVGKGSRCTGIDQVDMAQRLITAGTIASIIFQRIITVIIEGRNVLPTAIIIQDATHIGYRLCFCGIDICADVSVSGNGKGQRRHSLKAGVYIVAPIGHRYIGIIPDRSRTGNGLAILVHIVRDDIDIRGATVSEAKGRNRRIAAAAAPHHGEGGELGGLEGDGVELVGVHALHGLGLDLLTVLQLLGAGVQVDHGQAFLVLELLGLHGDGDFLLGLDLLALADEGDVGSHKSGAAHALHGVHGGLDGIQVLQLGHVHLDAPGQRALGSLDGDGEPVDLVRHQGLGGTVGQRERLQVFPCNAGVPALPNGECLHGQQGEHHDQGKEQRQDLRASFFHLVSSFGSMPRIYVSSGAFAPRSGARGHSNPYQWYFTTQTNACQLF